MKKYRRIKDGIETNCWLETTGGADYWEPSFGDVGTYEIVVEEFDPDAGKAKAEALAYLASTDWYVIRASEEPTMPIPDEILQLRKQARLNAK